MFIFCSCYLLLFFFVIFCPLTAVANKAQSASTFLFNSILEILQSCGLWTEELKHTSDRFWHMLLTLLSARLNTTIYDHVILPMHISGHFICEYVPYWLVYVGIIGHCSLVGILYSDQSTTHCQDNNLRTTAEDGSVNTAYLGWNHIFQLQQDTVYPRLPSVLPWQMSQSLHHLGVLGALGAMLSLLKSEHSNPLSQSTEHKWEDKTERSSVWMRTKLHSTTLWTCKEIWRWAEWKWLADSCFAAKIGHVLCNVVLLQWALFHTGAWMGCDVDSRYWQDEKARGELPMMCRCPPHAQSPR